MRTVVAAINWKIVLVIVSASAAAITGIKTLSSNMAPVTVVVYQPAPTGTMQLTPAEKKSVQQAYKGFEATKKQKEFNPF